MIVCKELLTVLAAWCLWFTAESASIRTNRRDTPYYWMCPEVICPPVARGCSYVEYMVFQYDYEVRGRIVNVRCESCEYCLDLPTSLTSPRHRRSASSLLHHLGGSNHSPCPENLPCPVMRESCADERLTNLIFNNVVCKRCPACYDNTLLSAGDGDPPTKE